MPDSAPSVNQIAHVLADACRQLDADAATRTLQPLAAPTVARVLETFAGDDRRFLFLQLPSSLHGEVLLHMSEVAAADLARHLDPGTLSTATREMDPADLAELLDVLPGETGDDLLASMDALRRARVEANRAYDEDTAGRIMHVDAVTVREDVTLETVTRYLRRLEDLPSDTDLLMVLDRDGRFQGELPILTLLREDPETLVARVMVLEPRSLAPETPTAEVARLFEDHDRISVPVVEPDGTFLGRVVVDDVVDIIRQQVDHAALSPAGLDDEEDLLGPILPSAGRRMVWLGVNLGTALLASWVIGLFEATLEQVVALAILMPVVASMGGIAGTQTLTLTIRGLAQNRITPINARGLLRKEVTIGLLNGVVWALVVGGVATVWFDRWDLGVVIALAMVANMVVAAAAGLVLPLTLRRMGIDPALSGAVVLTTVTDVVGFVAFLGIGTLLLL